ncbi:MAG: response regulator [Longimicrobiales bacterium]
MARILVADWDEIERVSLWTILRKAGHELLFAKDGKQAIEIWEKKPIDLVITELLMPELSGLRLIREIIERDAGARIIAISLVNADQLDLAEDFGAMRVLFKPVRPKTLLKTVEEVLGGFRPRKEPWRER